MRRACPEGLTVRITQPNGLHLQYLGVRSIDYKEQWQVFAIILLPLKTTIFQEDLCNEARRAEGVSLSAHSLPRSARDRGQTLAVFPQWRDGLPSMNSVLCCILAEAG